MKLSKALLVSAAFVALTAGSAHADILLGMAGPLTGGEAAIGDQEKHGFEMAVADLNAKGGILGQQIKTFIEDDACDPKQAVAVANRMASNNVVAVIGHMCSGSTIPASSVYNESNILMITPSATNPKVTDDAFKNHWNNIYRVCGRDDDQGKVAADYILKHAKDKPVAIVDDKSAYGKGLAEETRKALNAAGKKEAMYEEISAGDTDFSALITKMKSEKIDTLFYGGYSAEAGLITRQARDQGLKMTILSDDGISNADYYAITGAAGDGTLLTFAPDPEKRVEAKAVIDAFKKSGWDPAGYTLYTYAAVQVFAQAAEKAKSTKLADLAKTMHSDTFNTVIGPIKYNEKGDVAGNQFVIWEWRGGKFSQLP